MSLTMQTRMRSNSSVTVCLSVLFSADERIKSEMHNNAQRYLEHFTKINNGETIRNANK